MGKVQAGTGKDSVTYTGICVFGGGGDRKHMNRDLSRKSANTSVEIYRRTAVRSSPGKTA
jgi:hypothetical protein